VNRLATPLLAAVLAIAVATCQPIAGPGAPGTTTSTATIPVEPATTTSTTPATSTTSTTTAAGPSLAALAIDDHPNGAGYRRDRFMPGGRWQDPDGNGCNARQDALRAQSLVAIQAPGCSTAGGVWSLAYVPGETTVPADVDVDHVVPLANAWRSGARNWETGRLVAYAADPVVLWVVDDGANQAKGDKGPEAWRPAVRAVWCTYAHRWISIKVTYGLTATTAERDALGQMMEECQ
jgi:hypothetical protein